MADTTSSSAPAAKNRSVQGGVLSATGSGAPSTAGSVPRLEGVGAAAQDDAVLGEGRRRRVHDLVERPPPERDLLEAEAHVHVVAGVDGVVHAAGLDVRDALQQEQLVAVQRGGCTGDAEDPALHHVLQPGRELRAAVLRDADGLLLLPLHRDQQARGGAVARRALQVEHGGDARRERRRGGPGR
jgi:hypothetical protein